MPTIFLIHGRISHLKHRYGEGVAMTWSVVWEMLSRWSTWDGHQIISIVRRLVSV